MTNIEDYRYFTVWPCSVYSEDIPLRNKKFGTIHGALFAMKENKLALRECNWKVYGHLLFRVDYIPLAELHRLNYFKEKYNTDIHGIWYEL